MTKREVLDEWAAKFVGEDEDTVADAVGSQWYTTSPGAAFVVLAKAAAEGKRVELEMEGGEVSVECGGAETNGDAEDLAELIVQACYDCHNG